jgi:hypothetical protein
MRKTYARLSRTASEDQSDRRALAVLDVVASAAAAAASEAELALVDGRGHDDRSCVEQVGEGGSELHDEDSRVCVVKRVEDFNVCELVNEWDKDTRSCL